MKVLSSLSARTRVKEAMLMKIKKQMTFQQNGAGQTSLSSRISKPVGQKLHISGIIFIEQTKLVELWGGGRRKRG
jgi:hypothetical protein